MQYWDGSAVLSETDIDVPRGGVFSQIRVLVTQGNPAGPTAPAAYDGPYGPNWHVRNQSYAKGFVAEVMVPVPGHPGEFTTELKGSVQVVFDPNNPFWFDTNNGHDYIPRYSEVDVSLTQDDTAGTLKFINAKNGQVEITVFANPNLSNAGARGGPLLNHTDAQGNYMTSSTVGDTTTIVRTYYAGGVTVTETLTCTTDSVTLSRQVDTAEPTDVQRVSYLYYGADNPNGVEGDLQLAIQQLPDGSGGWNDVAFRYYRYYTSGSNLLKMSFGPEAYRRMINAGIVDLDSMADSVVQPYADNYFEYNSLNCVTKEVAAVCDTCVGGGTTADTFSYTINPNYPDINGYNAWYVKTTQTLPDGSSIIVYSNLVGWTMLYVNVDSSNVTQSIRYFQYDENALLVMTAESSAMSGYDDTSDDLVDGGTWIRTGEGLIRSTAYNLYGYPVGEYVSQGLPASSGILVRSYLWESREYIASGLTYTWFVVVAQSDYPNATLSDPGDPVTTTFDYDYSATALIQRTTTLPAVSAAQNGANVADTIVELYSDGLIYQRTDERGVVTTYSYGVPRGCLAYQTLDAATGGLNLTTQYTYDSLGRPTGSVGPFHTAVVDGVAMSVTPKTWTVYIDTPIPGSGAWAPNQALTGMGFQYDSTTILVNPVTLQNLDKTSRVLDQITSARTTGSGALSASDTFAQTDWQSWTSYQYDIQNHLLSQRVYFLIPSSGTGSIGTNYGETDYGYDALERRNKTYLRSYFAHRLGRQPHVLELSDFPLQPGNQDHGPAARHTAEHVSRDN